MYGRQFTLFLRRDLHQGGGGGIEVRNFSQFSAISQFFAIFRNFSQFSAIFRNFSAIFHTSRFSDRLPTLVQNNENFFFLLFHTLSNVAKSPEPGIAQLVVPLHCSSRVLGSNPVGHNMVTFAFLVFFMPACLHVCMCMSDVPEIAEQWSLYIRCNVVDINGPTALLEWWQSRAPSPFQERVLFLITQPTSGGDVERFFSQCRTVSKRQHILDDNIRRLRFMLQFHGDIEGRLL